MMADNITELAKLDYTGEEAALARLEKQNRIMGNYLEQMARLLDATQRRLGELEKQQAPLTVTHKQQKALVAHVKARADELIEKHGLAPSDGAALRRAIRQAILRQYAIDDLHDLPASCLTQACSTIDRWTSLALIRKLRGAANG